MFRRLVATSRTPPIMVLSMLKSFCKIGPQIDQIWAWLSRGHRWSPGVRNPLKISVTGPSLLVNCYLEIKFHKIIRVKEERIENVMIVFGKVLICFRNWGKMLVSSFFTELRGPHRRSVSISIMDCICIYIHLFIY